MKRGREEKSHETLPSPTRLRHGGHTDIPFDLTVEILKKLPAKSLVRFLCVSKLWLSTISMNRYFIDSIVTRSLTQPPREAHIIYDNFVFYHEEYFLAYNDQVSIHYSIPEQIQQYVRGLIWCWSEGTRNQVAIYNPTTRQTFYLPEPKPRFMSFCFFGYDPVENKYKALFISLNSMDKPNQDLACQVFTLGDTTWRQVESVRSHFPMAYAVCINGVIYYRAINSNREDDATISEYRLISFDVRSEKFYDDVAAPKPLLDHNTTLINYQGKLGFVCCENGMEIWVMENANKGTQGWSRIFFYAMEGFERWRIQGATRGGEIVFSNNCYNGNMLRVFYYDPKRNSMRFVHLKGTYHEGRKRDIPTLLWSCLDHVENTMRLY